MSLSVSPPARIAALVGALVLTGLAAVAFFLGRGALGNEPAASTASTPVTRSTQPRGTAATAPKPKVATRTRTRAANSFPARIEHALRNNRVVVVSVSMPGAAVDAVVRREAREAARVSRSGFVAISALNERAVSALVSKTGLLPAPAVVIVERPGVVAATFSVTDAVTIAQAVAEARR